MRGLKTSAEGVGELKALQSGVRHVLNSEIFPMLERWTLTAAQEENIDDACLLHANLCVIFKNIHPKQYNQEIVSTLLSSQCFLNTRFRYSNYEYNNFDNNKDSAKLKQGKNSRPNNIFLITQISNNRHC